MAKHESEVKKHMYGPTDTLGYYLFWVKSWIFVLLVVWAILRPDVGYFPPFFKTFLVIPWGLAWLYMLKALKLGGMTTKYVMLGFLPWLLVSGVTVAWKFQAPEYPGLVHFQYILGWFSSVWHVIADYADLYLSFYCLTMTPASWMAIHTIEPQEETRRIPKFLEKMFGGTH